VLFQHAVYCTINLRFVAVQQCLRSSLSGATGHLFGCFSRLRIASLSPLDHFRAVGMLGADLPKQMGEIAFSTGVRVTRHALLSFEVLEKLLRWPDLPLFRILQALADAFLGIGAAGNVELALIGICVLHDGRCSPFHRKQHGALGFLELFHFPGRVDGILSVVWNATLQVHDKWNLAGETVRARLLSRTDRIDARVH
jgi:hypothetical protein